MIKEKNKAFKGEKGITLIALVVTIVVLLILAGVSFNLVIGNNGIITKAKEAVFKTEVAKYKSELDMKKLEQTMSSSVSTNVSDIYELEDILTKQINSLDKGIQNAADTISLVQTAEGALMQTAGILLEIHERLIKMQYNTNTETIRKEINERITGINGIADTTEFNNIKLLNGLLYDVKLGNGYIDQGKIVIDIDKADFKNIYGSETIDYTNLQQAIEKINGALAYVSNIRSKLGGKQNGIENTINHLTKLSNNITILKNNIFNNATEEQAIANAKSWNTTSLFVDIQIGAIENIEEMLLRNIEICDWCINDETIEEKYKMYMQHEIDELINEIDRELKYTQVANKKVFNGNFPYMNYMDITTLGIEKASVVENETLAKAKFEQAVDLITQKKTDLQNIKIGLASILNEEADEGYAFEITDNSNIYDQINNQINEKYSDKLKVINGRLTYIGNDKLEKEWAQNMGIDIL